MLAAILLRCFAKNNERLSGIEMKKFIILLLVTALLASLCGCKLLKKIGIGGPDASDICEIANNSNPTKITTEVSYVTKSGDKLTGYYVTTTDGTDTIFDYYYERFATPQESVANGNTDRIMKVEGVIYYKDGVYYDGNDEAWQPGSGTAFDLKLQIDEDVFKDATVSEDGTSFEGKVSAEDLVSVIGTSLNAVGDATVSVYTNGANLTSVVVTCATANGTMTVRTSYTYNTQNLFPEEAAE